jgi:predicted DNA-binding protein YlxM (UPF0122 family)
MEKDLRYVELFELYQGLLTEKQREMFLSHYCYDLSLAEIAEPEGSTRQSVYAVIKTVKEKLDEYEQKLGFLDKNQKLVEIAKQMDKANKEIADKILEIIGK